ncbi:MAG: PD-(D/E)XK nuclease family protein [Acidobacteria bacterium]|nr:PD-(D/E)XK nuclease family protein [Acidobacteriota bacterium]
MVTPRRTRLVRAPSLPAFQAAIARAVADADPECAVLVPTRSAAAHLRRTLAAVGAGGPAGASPASVRLLTRDAFYRHLHARLTSAPRLLAEVERETLARAAARDAVRAGAAPPFRLRPGLVRLMLGFHDELARYGRSVDTFERLAVEDLEPSAAVDRGARRLLDQTRFLVAAFRAFSARVAASGALDEHRLRALLLAGAPARPLREAIVTVADRAAQPGGLYPADFDLAARLPELARVTVIATDAVLDAGFRERLDDLLPGLDVERAPPPARRPPALVAPSGPDADGAAASGTGAAAPGTDAAAASGAGGAAASGTDAAAASGAGAGRGHFVWRDREEELAWVAGRVGGGEGPARAAVVVQRPLPYLYLAASVCADRSLPFAAHDGLPLATEPFAAAVDLVLACVREGFAREPLVALLGAPQLAFGADGAPRGLSVEALDRELEARRFTGGVDPLRELDREWVAAPPREGTRAAAARPAAAWAVAAADELAPLAEPAPPARGLDVLLGFLERHAAPSEREPQPEPEPEREPQPQTEPEREPQPQTEPERGARELIRDGLAALRDAARALPEPEPDTDAAGLADLVRGWLEGQPGPVPPAPRAAALHLVDAQAAPYGRFDDVYLAGLVDGEWPPPPPRNVFYPAAMLAGFGWPRERVRLRAARAAFRDLLGLARSRVALSAFALEDDAVVTQSVWLDDVPDAGLARIAEDARTAAAGDGTAAPAHSRVAPAAGGGTVAPVHPPVLSPLASAASAGPAAEWRAWRERRAARRGEVGPDGAAPDGAAPDGVAPDAPDAATAGGEGPAGVGPVPPGRGPYAVSALDRYLECPFKYFARHALALEPDAEDEGAFTPRRRGVFVHRVLEAFFTAWQAAGEGSVTLGSLDRALDRFRDVAGDEIARLPAADRAVARTWLLGSAAAPGLAERLFMAEVEHPADLVERRLEVRLDGTYALAGPAGPRRVALRGTADRIDLHADRTFRVLDYKADRPPRALRSLQLPVYAACAERRIGDGRGRWRAAGAAYVAFGDPRLEVPASGDDIEAAMRAGERRAVETVDAIERGAFPPRPADASRCRFCPYPTVCRKDDVGVG